MRVLNILIERRKTWGGPVRVVAELVRLQKTLGMHSTVLCLERGGEVESFEEAEEVFSFPASFPQRFSNSQAAIGWLEEKARSFDLVIVNEIWSVFIQRAMGVLRRQKVPYLVQPCGSLDPYDLQKKGSLKNILGPLIVRPNLDAASFALTASEIEKERLVQFGARGIVKSLWHPISAAATGNRARERTRLGCAPGDVIFLYLSRIDRKKRLDLLITAFLQVQPSLPGARLVVAGDGDPALVAELKKQAAESKASSVIQFVGFISGEGKRDLLAAADCFVLPSDFENFGIAVVEAMQAGCPVLIAKGVQIWREIEAAGAGLVFDGGVEGLMDGLRQMAGDPEKRKAMALQATKHGAEYSPGALAEEYATLWNACVRAEPESAGGRGDSVAERKGGLKVHLISNLFHPDELAGASLYTDLALFLRDQGHDVRVTTTFPYYPAWKLAAGDVGVDLREETYDGVPVRRVGMYVPATPTGLKRILSDLSFLWGLMWNGCFPGWRPDVVLTASPMFSQCLAQRFLYRGRSVPRLIVIQDFVVDAAIELKMFALPGLTWFLRRLERWAYDSAQTLVTISEPMLSKLKEKVSAGRRLLLLPNWIHGSLQREIDAQKAQPVNRLQSTLLYAGNVGVKQGLPDFVHDFKECHGAWQLTIHGGGAEVERLRTLVAGVPSVTIGEVLDESAYVQALRTASACLVTQKPGLGANFLPSKLLPALAAGSPILAVCDSESPLGCEVLAGGFGAVLPPGNVERLREVLARWIAEPELLSAMSRRATERAALYHRQRILSLYEQELWALVAGSKVKAPLAAETLEATV